MFAWHDRLYNIYKFLVPVSGSLFSGATGSFGEVIANKISATLFTGPAGSAAVFTSASIGDLRVGQTQVSGSQAWVTSYNNGSSLDFDLAHSNNHAALITSPTSSITTVNQKVGGVYVWELSYSGSNEFVVNWPAAFKWPNNLAPTIKNYADPTGSIAGRDVFTGYWNGTNMLMGCLGQRYDY